MVYGYYSYYGFVVIVVDGSTTTKEFSSEEEARESYERIDLIDGPEELEDMEDE